MIGHLEAMKSLLEAAGLNVYLIDATGATKWPRVTITPGYGRTGVDRPVSDDRDDLDEDIRVTCASLTADSLLRVTSKVRAVLSPGNGVRRLDVPGRSAELKFLRHEMTSVDRNATDVATNRDPIYTVETFHLVSTPTT